LTPGYEVRAGGVMTIASLYRETIALKDLHRARVALCTVPGYPPFLKYSWFENNNYILNLEELLMGCGQLDFWLLHVPAYSVDRVADWLRSVEDTVLRRIKEIQLNVLLMNIDNIQGKNVAALARFGKVTCTTAHEAYTNKETRAALGVTLHRLLVCNGPERFSVTGYNEKQQMMIVSYDPHPLKDRVLRKIGEAYPDLMIRIIEDLSYEDYMALTQSAKWALTFGEGLDGYFVESVYTGGIPFAVLNNRYFTPAFSRLENVYSSWDELLERIVPDLKRLDEPTAYEH